MYESHFGLIRRPFGETVDPSAYVALPSRETALRRLRYGMEHGQGAAILFGPPGSGKTLLAHALADSQATSSVHLTFPAMPAADLFAYLADELGAGPPAGGFTAAPPLLGTTLNRLRARLADAAARGVRPLLIVDEAQLIDDPATFEALRSVLNFATFGPPDLMLLLVGGAEIFLKLPAGLADRVAARCLIGPLTESETAAYVNGRLAAAGAAEPLFASDALAALHRAGDGLPRRLNRLADLALLITYAEGSSRPGVREVAIAARELDPESLAA